jgi:hypothetical protein
VIDVDTVNTAPASWPVKTLLPENVTQPSARSESSSRLLPSFLASRSAQHHVYQSVSGETIPLVVPYGYGA